MQKLAGRRATVMGLGRHGGGVAVARWLAGQEVQVTVTDLADERALADSLAALAGVPIRCFHLGRHRAVDFRETDLVVVNPAVRPGDPYVRLAVEAGAQITSETELFLEACRAPVIGVTGSNGKSTTAAMTASVLSAAGRRTWLGGNIGRSLLSELPRMAAEDWVVLELSSFQLHWLGGDVRSPQIAVVTNFSPNHLDWHGTVEHYAAAKQRLLVAQRAGDVAVLNRTDPAVAAWSHLVRGRTADPVAVDRLPWLAVSGMHNRINAACAATAAVAAIDCGPMAIEHAMSRFTGLPHRLELVDVCGGRSFYNDSMATTPESVVAAIDTFGGRGWFLVGGYDKGIDFEPLARRLARDARGIACFGAVRARLESLVARHSPRGALTSVDDLEEAVEWCWRHSHDGDCIVLSPACASYDQFRDYRERGAAFTALAARLRQRCNR